MLKALFILGITNGIAVSGCASPRDYHQVTEQVAEYGTQTIEIRKYNLVCVAYRDNDNNSFSCVHYNFKKGE